MPSVKDFLDYNVMVDDVDDDGDVRMSPSATTCHYWNNMMLMMKRKM
jgi:hypothetical protein